jgi:IclR family transcriptional regulator, pca regulon regulatory protein
VWVSARLGYVRCEGREFSLLPRVLELGHGYLSGRALPDVAAPDVEELVARLRESASISVLDGQQVVFVLRLKAKQIPAAQIEGDLTAQGQYQARAVAGSGSPASC